MITLFKIINFQKIKSELQNEIEQLQLRESALETRLLNASNKFKPFHHEASFEGLIGDKGDSDVNQNHSDHHWRELLPPFYDRFREASDWQNLLNEKTLQIADLRERLIFTEEECRLFKEENETSNALLTQMGKDLRVLMDAVKDSKT